MLIFYTKRGTVFKRRPKQGERVTIGWRGPKWQFPFDTKYVQYYDKLKMKKLESYLEAQDRSAGNVLVFEDHKGQIQGPDGRKKMLGMYFEWGEFRETATNGYVRLSKPERIILQAYSDKTEEIFDHKGFFELIPDGNTIERELIEVFKADPFLKPLQGVVQDQYEFGYQGEFFGSGERVKLIGTHIVKPNEPFWIKEMASAILRELWSIGYRFTTLKTLKSFNSKSLLGDKMRTKKGVIMRKDLEQVEDNLFINYTIKKIS